MQTVINNIFGVYTPVMDSNGVIPSGMAGVDWSYVAGVVLFAVVLLCFFKIVGAVIKR